jgi:hypothetical protein
MYNEKLATNLTPLQMGMDYKKRDTPFIIKSVVRECKNVDCTATKTVKVIGA